MKVHIDAEHMDGNVKEIILLAEDVMTELGPGHREYVYDRALQAALANAGIPHESQPIIPVIYRGKTVSYVQPDFVVGGSLVVELKVQLSIQEMHRIQARKYLRTLNAPVVLLINFPLVKTWKYTISHERVENRDHSFFALKHSLTQDLLEPFADLVKFFTGKTLNPINGEPEFRIAEIEEADRAR